MQVSTNILHSFEIDEQLLPANANEEERFEAFRQLLVRRVEELLERDLPKLLWILYRIDVNEKKLYETIQQTQPEQVSNAIVDLIIQRQVQKAESRKQFGGMENDWNFDI